MLVGFTSGPVYWLAQPGGTWSAPITVAGGCSGVKDVSDAGRFVLNDCPIANGGGQTSAAYADAPYGSLTRLGGLGPKSNVGFASGISHGGRYAGGYANVNNQGPWAFTGRCRKPHGGQIECEQMTATPVPASKRPLCVEAPAMTTLGRCARHVLVGLKRSLWIKPGRTQRRNPACHDRNADEDHGHRSEHHYVAWRLVEQQRSDRIPRCPGGHGAERQHPRVRTERSP